jgi:hypothetical protein
MLKFSNKVIGQINHIFLHNKSQDKLEENERYKLYIKTILPPITQLIAGCDISNADSAQKVFEEIKDTASIHIGRSGYYSSERIKLMTGLLALELYNRSPAVFLELLKKDRLGKWKGQSDFEIAPWSDLSQAIEYVNISKELLKGCSNHSQEPNPLYPVEYNEKQYSLVKS